MQEEFPLIDEMLSVRKKAGKTLDDVAKKMNTKTSVVRRLETGGGQLKHSPSIATLCKYASAINCKLEVRFKHIKPNIKVDNKKIKTAS